MGSPPQPRVLHEVRSSDEDDEVVWGEIADAALAEGDYAMYARIKGIDRPCIGACISQEDAWGRQADSAHFSCASCSRYLCVVCVKNPVVSLSQVCAPCNEKPPEADYWGDREDEKAQLYAEDLAAREARQADATTVSAGRDRYADRVNPSPVLAELKPWLDLAELIECQVCLAEPGRGCTGKAAEEVEPGRFLCSERVDQVPVPTAPECPRCHGSCVDTPNGWSRHCYSHLTATEQAAIDRSKVAVGYRNPKKRLRIDVDSAISNSCVLCGVRPGHACRTTTGNAARQPHIERVDSAQRLRRAQQAAAN